MSGGKFDTLNVVFKNWSGLFIPLELLQFFLRNDDPETQSVPQ